MSTPYSTDYAAFGKPELAVVSISGNDVNFAEYVLLSLLCIFAKLG